MDGALSRIFLMITSVFFSIRQISESFPLMLTLAEMSVRLLQSCSDEMKQLAEYFCFKYAGYFRHELSPCQSKMIEL